MDKTHNENMNAGGETNSRPLDRMIDYLLNLSCSQNERKADSNLSFQEFGHTPLEVNEVQLDKLDIDSKDSENSRLWIGVVIAIIVFVGSLVLLPGVLAKYFEELCEKQCWMPFVYLVIAALLLSVGMFVLFRHWLLIYRGQKENEFKQQEWLMREKIRLLDEDRDFARLKGKTEMAIYDKLEKAGIDDWVRDKEHLRKMEIMQQERITELSKVLLELVKTKDVISVKSNDKEEKITTIERSILSDDFFLKLDDVLKDLDV